MLISHWSEFSHMAILRQKKRLGIVFILGGHVSSNKKRENGRWETSISFCHDYNEESLKLTLRNVGPLELPTRAGALSHKSRACSCH